MSDLEHVEWCGCWLKDGEFAAVCDHHREQEELIADLEYQVANPDGEITVALRTLLRDCLAVLEQMPDVQYLSVMGGEMYKVENYARWHPTASALRERVRKAI